MRHLLVTNDFPPKVGGIQSYLWELWRRLPPAETFVYTTPYRGTASFDEAAPMWIGRSAEPVLLPNPVLTRRIRALARSLDVDLVVLDPAVPLGMIGPFLGVPYGVVLHGAEVTIPGRLPISNTVLGRVLRNARVVISAGAYPAAEAARCAGRPLPTVIVPPGVDQQRFRPATAAERSAARARLGLDDDDLVVASLSRLVPRKGMDTLIRASALLRGRQPSLRVLIGGRGRQASRLRGLVASCGAPVELVGFVDDADTAAFYGCADVFAMLCRSRWAGLEQEGFGIVLAEASACGVPVVCGRSGGAAEVVDHGRTGLVVGHPSSAADAADALDELLADPRRRARMGGEARRRAVARFSYDHLSDRLATALDGTALDATVLDGTVLERR